MRFLKVLSSPLVILVLLIIGAYYQFFFQGKIPVPADTLVGAYYPWLDYKWGFSVGVPVKNPPLSDSFSQFFLWKHLAVDLFKSGQIPLWNPYQSSGAPFLATYHSAVLLPFNLLLLLPKNLGWGVYIFGQTLVAALGIYFLAGFYTKNSLAKIAGALVFSMSGLMTTWLELGTGVYSAAMLPWIIFFLESFLKSKKVRYLGFFSLAFVFLFLAGHAQLTLYSSGLLFAFLLFKFFVKELNKKEFLGITFFLVFEFGDISCAIFTNF